MRSHKSEIVQILNTMSLCYSPITRRALQNILEYKEKKEVGRFHNNIKRLLKICLIEGIANAEGVRFTRYQLTERGHEAVANKFENNEFLYPHSNRMQDYNEDMDDRTHIPSKEAELNMLFFTVTHQRTTN